jgi:argininosuccinate lyase
MLGKQSIISKEEAESIISGLNDIRKEIESGAFKWKEELEDIHMNIEARLHENIGDVAGKLHTARSRNDQVSTDLRLFLKDGIRDTLKEIVGLQKSIVETAKKHKRVSIPGYTHLQRAQPVLLAHHLLAYFEMFERDKERFMQVYSRTNILPLGSGALAGVPYPLDREFVAKELGFTALSKNSMDAVSDRDFVLDYLSAAATCMMHLSRLGEELIIWSTQEFSFIRLSNEYSTGSSIMPQKRNPDFAELGRGKTGRVFGNLMGMLTVMKGLPLTYNRDMQEDKESLFDTVDTLTASLGVFGGMISSMEINQDRIKGNIDDGYILATDLADYLVKKGLPFRQAHGVVNSLVSYAADNHKGISDLTLDEYKKFSELFLEDVHSISVDSSIDDRKVIGGTSSERVENALRDANKLLEKSLHLQGIMLLR